MVQALVGLWLPIWNIPDPLLVVSIMATASQACQTSPKVGSLSNVPRLIVYYTISLSLQALSIEPAEHEYLRRSKATNNVAKSGNKGISPEANSIVGHLSSAPACSSAHHFVGPLLGVPPARKSAHSHSYFTSTRAGTTSASRVLRPRLTFLCSLPCTQALQAPHVDAARAFSRQLRLPHH